MIYIINVGIAIILYDLGLVFELISGFTLSFLNYIWPGMFYLMAEKRFGSEEGSKGRLIHRIHSYI